MNEGLKEPDLQEFLESERLKAFHYKFTAITNLAMPLWILSWLEDLYYCPDRKWTLLLFRISVVVLLALSNVGLNLARHSFFKVQLIGIAVVVLHSSALTYLIKAMGALHSFYWPVINLVPVGAVAMIPWRRQTVFIPILVCYIPFYAMCIDWNEAFAERIRIMAYSFYHLDVAIVSAVVYIITDSLRERECILRFQLKERTETLQSTLLELNKSQDQLDEVNMQIAHDIRSPLTVLKVLLEDSRQTSDEKSFLMKTAIERVNGIIGTLAFKHN